MGTSDGSKKKIHLWKKAAIHFSLCFVTGFFTGFAPTTTTTTTTTTMATSSFIFTSQTTNHLQNISSQTTIQPFKKTVENGTLSHSLKSENNSSFIEKEQEQEPKEEEEEEAQLKSSPNSLIIITTTRPGDKLQGPLLLRLAHTLKLVQAPIVWVVVEAHKDAPQTADLLRRTGVMYRHLTYKENFTGPDSEADHQRNVALNHIEYHRLDGIVHFADVTNTYDLQFFDEIRKIVVFGTWPVAMVSENRRGVMVEGPVCHKSGVVGWQLKDLNNDTNNQDSITIPLYFNNVDTNNGTNQDLRPTRINISTFAFNSSVLWDPERWGRPSSVLDTSQDSIKFVQEVVLEDETKLKGIPSECSKIMLWHLHISRASQYIQEHKVEIKRKEKIYRAK